PASPAIVREGPVGFRHPVRVLALLHGVPPAIRRVEQLGGEPLGHGLLIAVVRGGDDPADTEGLAPRGAHLDRHLIGGAADAARTHLDRRHHVVERLLEHGDRILPGLALDHVERAVDDVLGHRLLAGMHHRVHEFRDHDVPEFRVRQDLTLVCPVAAGHLSISGSCLSLASALYLRPTGLLPATVAFSTQNDPTWVALLRISNAAACGFSRPAYRARHAGCDSARPGDL